MSQDNIQFVDLNSQHRKIESEIQATIMEVVEKGDFILGREVERFEAAFAKYCDAKYAVGVDSGTSALHLALEALDVGPGDEVITTANTFIATACAITYTGAKPVFVDVDPLTYTMDPEKLGDAITERTKAVIPVHLYGQPADMDPIIEIAGEHGLHVVEDACQAHGARYKGKRVGSIGNAAAFSFYPAKNLGGFGDGGMIVSNDPMVARKARLLRNFGQDYKNVHLLGGYNRRLDTLQAAVLRTKLRYLDSWNKERVRNAWMYSHLLLGGPLTPPDVAAYAGHVFHLYVIQIDQRDELKVFLAERGIATGIHYPTPIHLQPAFSSLEYPVGSFPVAESAAQKILSLPMYPGLEVHQIERVCEAIYNFSTLKNSAEVMRVIEETSAIEMSKSE